MQDSEESDVGYDSIRGVPNGIICVVYVRTMTNKVVVARMGGTVGHLQPSISQRQARHLPQTPTGSDYLKRTMSITPMLMYEMHTPLMNVRVNTEGSLGKRYMHTHIAR